VFSNIGGTGLAPSSLSSLLSSLVFLSPSLGIMSGRIKANEKVHYIASTTFTIDRTYSDLKLIGKGSYGIVCSANDHTNNTKVAIKKITPMAKDLLDAKHVLREIRLMRHMGKHENIISLINLMVREAADELYIVMELLDSDLHRVLQSPQILTQSHFRFFLFQLLCGVKYLHDNRIIHRYRHLCLSLSLSRSLSGSLCLSRSFSLSLSHSLWLWLSRLSICLSASPFLALSRSLPLCLSLSFDISLSNLSGI
jgi:hypothetical protein